MMIFALLLACAKPFPPQPPVPERPPIIQHVEPEALPGSLWSEVGARQLIGMDGNARRVGDLITVTIDETTATSLGANTSTSRSSEAEFHIDALLGVENSITNPNPNMGGEIKLGGGSDSNSEGKGTTARTGSLEAMVTCQVIEVLPSGNLRIRGTKAIRVNRETQYLALEGIVRPRDILLDNTVRSDLLAEARIEFTGSGVLAKDQGSGWATGIANTLWPF
jgi:flagellar L-ring protein precursor FlgH